MQIQFQGLVVCLIGALRITESEWRLLLKLPVVLFNLYNDVVHKVRFVDIKLVHDLSLLFASTIDFFHFLVISFDFLISQVVPLRNSFGYKGVFLGVFYLNYIWHQGLNLGAWLWVCTVHELTSLLVADFAVSIRLQSVMGLLVQVAFVSSDDHSIIGI